MELAPQACSFQGTVDLSRNGFSAPVARIYGEPLEQLPLDLYIPPDALAIMLDAFEGPLDLLLDRKSVV